MKPFIWLGLTSRALGHGLVESKSNGHSVAVPLEQHFNNKAFGSHPGEAALDTFNQSYPADPVGIDGYYTSKSTGITYRFPGYNPDPDGQDNIICEGQTIDISPSDGYFAASMLMVSDVRSTTVSDNVTLLYTDNTTSTAEVRAHAFWWFLSIRRGEITYPYFFTHNDTNHNASEIYEQHAPINTGKTLRGIILPNTTNTTTGRLHVFALSLWQASEDKVGVDVQAVRPTQKFDSSGHQIVEVILNHSGDKCASGISISVDSTANDQVYTPEPALVKRLCPGDQKRIPVSVVGRSDNGVNVTLNMSNQQPIRRQFEDTSIGLNEWTPDASSLIQHESPQWYDDAKFGIFIHWGPYSVPAWGNSTPNECYAEWFWWYSTRVGHDSPADPCGVNAYRERTFGAQLNYDDFFPNFTASQFDAKDLVDLISDSGAKYFVFTTKHHDGFANFDAGATTNRTSLHHGPHRDLLGEIFSAAETHHPDLKRGTYFSLPEWFNPDWGKYGFAQYDRVTSTTHPGIIARNPYTNLTEPYTGRLPHSDDDDQEEYDFIRDLMLPQLEILAYEYKTDILWCDAGAANATDSFAAEWFNWASSSSSPSSPSPRQVTLNDRCGSPWSADFDTPEYQVFEGRKPQERKWESNLGMDPYSYGYNRATGDEEYMTSGEIVRYLVDVVSKGGNLLLNIGPREDGSVHERMVEGLRGAGEWLRGHNGGEGVFGSAYWYLQEDSSSSSSSSSVDGEGNDSMIRFTQTGDAFYVFVLEEPGLGRLLVGKGVPVLEGDRVVALGMDGEEVDVKWGWGVGGDDDDDDDDDDKVFWIEVTEEVVKGDKFCWVFKIEYGG